ncbi:hypothetical protein ACSSZE_03250 [Acidithiobacillus caldus]
MTDLLDVPPLFIERVTVFVYGSHRRRFVIQSSSVLTDAGIFREFAGQKGSVVVHGVLLHI